MNSKTLLDQIPQKFVAPLVLLMVLGLGGASYFYFSNRAAQEELAAMKSNPDLLANSAAIELATEVGNIMVLPQGEVPIVATVTDPDKLKDQAFFAGAKAGDKVLIFNGAGKAVLYDPSIHKIVNIGPINEGEGVLNK